VLPVVVQPLSTHTAIKRLRISFMIHPSRLTSAANSSIPIASSIIRRTRRCQRLAMNVIVTPALRAQEPIIQNLVQLYTHDFSEFWAGTPRGDLRPDGRFDPYPLDGYWTRPGWSAALISSGGVLAGFALINDQARSGQPVDHNVGEFFILRKHRGHGVGRRAAEAIFSQAPGSWEVAVARKNVAAGEFWRKTIDAPQASNIHELDVATDQWNGPVFRFAWRT
jgi:predicted acetyltransferase